MKWSADFETTTDKYDCRVWASGIHEIGGDKFYYGNSIDYMMQFMQDHDGDIFYFHNLKFDGEFILNWLFQKGFTHVKSKYDLDPMSFTTLISDSGMFYSMEICFLDMSQVTIYDSLKIIPMSVDAIAKAFDLPLNKLIIDYTSKREVDHKLTQKEVDYLKHDVKIVSLALDTLFSQGLNKMTQGSNALEDFKKSVGKKNFTRWFPAPTYDADIRLTYKGGFCYCNPKFQGMDIGPGIVLDVNSLYPSVMYYQPLPYGDGVYFKDKYIKDIDYPLYTQNIRCEFELKEGYIPTIQIKNNRSSFMPTEYLTSSNGEEVTLYLTCVDLELFLEHYDVYNLEYLDGYKFRQSTGVFKDYIDKWMTVKIESTKTGNAGMRTLAKLMLNSLYGKFALNPRVQSKIPYYKDGIVKYRLGEIEERKPLYIPAGTFITAWARYKTITSAQSVYDRFLYSDTDSIHLIGINLPKELEIDKYALGAWDCEAEFTRARFIRQKTYIEEIDASLHITCAGMPQKCYSQVTWDNFKLGSVFTGKLKPTHVPNGIVLEETEFTIRD